MDAIKESLIIQRDIRRRSIVIPPTFSGGTLEVSFLNNKVGQRIFADSFGPFSPEDYFSQGAFRILFILKESYIGSAEEERGKNEGHDKAEEYYDTVINRVELALIGLDYLDDLKNGHSPELLSMESFNRPLYELLYAAIVTGVEDYLRTRLKKDVVESEDAMRKYLRRYNDIYKNKSEKRILFSKEDSLDPEVREKVLLQFGHHREVQREGTRTLREEAELRGDEGLDAGSWHGLLSCLLLGGEEL